MRCALLLVVALLGVASEASAKGSPRIERWLGRELVRVLENGDRVESFALGPAPVGPRGYLDENTGYLPPGSPATIGRYPVRRVAVQQGREFAQELARLLLDERSYHPRAYPLVKRGTGLIKGCIFTPGVVFRIWARRKSVDVTICFGCDQVIVEPTGVEARGVGGDIDPGRAAFVRLAKSVFEDDPRISKLAETQKYLP